MINFLNIVMTGALLTNMGVNIYQQEYGEAIMVLAILVIWQIAVLNRFSEQEKFVKEINQLNRQK